jgi:hypothetical protein
MIIYFHKSLDRLGVWLNVELAKTETIQRLFQAMLPKLLLRCQKLFFILAQVERIGHVGVAILFLKTLYCAPYDRIVVLIGRP